MTKLTIAAAALGAAFLGLPALASAQTAHAVTPIDCMQRDGGPSGCSHGQVPHGRFFYGRGAWSARPFYPAPSDYYGYYAPRRVLPFF